VFKLIQVLLETAQLSILFIATFNQARPTVCGSRRNQDWFNSFVYFLKRKSAILLEKILRLLHFVVLYP
jgi:hypothetical protein